jgi:hypothetical protein
MANKRIKRNICNDLILSTIKTTVLQVHKHTRTARLRLARGYIDNHTPVDENAVPCVYSHNPNIPLLFLEKIQLTYACACHV